MKFKILLLFCLFLTGCSVTYNLTIDDNTFEENVVFAFSKSTTSYSELSFYLNDKIPIGLSDDNKKFYNSEIKDVGDVYNLIYNFNHEEKFIENSYFVNNCYPNVSIINNNEIISISSGKGFNCFIGDDGLKADSVKINIKTDLKVLENNADEVNDNVYTWNINYTNYSSKEIILKLENSDKNTLENFKNNNGFLLTLVVIVIFIIVVSIIIYLIVWYKKRKNNEV